MLLLDIAKRVNVLAGDAVDIAEALHAAHADTADVHLLAGRTLNGAAKDVSRHNGNSRC